MSLVLSVRAWLSGPSDDENLMQRYALTGEPKLLSVLYDRRADDLFHFLLALSGTDMAQDVAQKTWLRVIEKRHLYAASGRFKSWLFTLGRRILLDELRKPANKQEHTEFEDVASPTHAPDNGLRQAFGAVLNTLPFEQREAFCLQQEGFGLQEIANMCECGTETVKSRLRYARKALRTRLEHYDE